MYQVKVNSQDVANIQLPTLSKITHCLKGFKLQKFFNPFCFFYDFKLLSVFTDYMHEADKKIRATVKLLCPHSYYMQASIHKVIHKTKKSIFS